MSKPRSLNIYDYLQTVKPNMYTNLIKMKTKRKLAPNIAQIENNTKPPEGLSPYILQKKIEKKNIEIFMDFFITIFLSVFFY